MPLLPPSDHPRLAASLPDTPATTIPLHALLTSRCRAYATWHTPTHLRAALIDPDLTPGELIAFSPDDDPTAILNLLSEVPTWTCLEVPETLASPLATLLHQSLHRPLTQTPDLFHTLTTPAPIIPHPSIRLLTRDDADLYTRSAPSFGDDPTTALQNLQEGPVAAAILDNQIVCTVEANVRTPRHANLTAETLPAFRNQGLCTATASLAARAAQSLGLTPVWSTTPTNPASLKVAQTLGFTESTRWTYLVPQ